MDPLWGTGVKGKNKIFSLYYLFSPAELAPGNMPGADSRVPTAGQLRWLETVPRRTGPRIPFRSYVRRGQGLAGFLTAASPERRTVAPSMLVELMTSVS